MERRPPTGPAAQHARAPLIWHGRSQHGATLLELLTSTLFVSILMAISYTFARAALMSARVQEVKSEAQEATVMALDLLARELRMAGYSAVGDPLTAIREAATDRIEVACDLNGDGDTADANEVIAYGYDATTHELTRSTGGGSPQPFVGNVPAGGVQFAYFDATGQAIPGESGLTSTDRKRIHRIDVVVHVELANPDPAAKQALTSTAATSVCLRNQ